MVRLRPRSDLGRGLALQIAGEGRHHLGLRAGRAREQQVVLGGLVLLAKAEQRLHAERFEQVAVEAEFQGDAGGGELAHRLQPDLVEGRCEMVGGIAGAHLAEAVGEHVGRLAGGAHRRQGGGDRLVLRQVELAVAEIRRRRPRPSDPQRRCGARRPGRTGPAAACRRRR